MSNLQITTNNVPRPLVPRSALPEKVRKDFDYIETWDETPRFVKYHGEWYDVIDTQRISTSKLMGRVGWEMNVDTGHPFAEWDAVVSDSFFSGMLFRFTGGDTVVVGSFC